MDETPGEIDRLKAALREAILDTQRHTSVRIDWRQPIRYDWTPKTLEWAALCGLDMDSDDVRRTYRP